MAINGATPIVGATTYVAPTGGSADTLSAFGSNGGVTAIFDGDTELLTQKKATFTAKDPQVQVSAPNGYTQAKRQAYIRVPLTLDNGNITTNSIRVEVSVDPETTAAEIAELRLLASQILGDSDFTPFWSLGVLE